MVAHAHACKIYCSRSSSATVEGQPRLHKTLSQPAPFFHSRRKALRTVTAIKVVIVSRREPGNSCMLVVKIKMARRGSRGSPGWTNETLLLQPPVCKDTRMCYHACISLFSKTVGLCQHFLICSTLPLLSASSSNVHILVLAFFFHM